MVDPVPVPEVPEVEVEVAVEVVEGDPTPIPISFATSTSCAIVSSIGTEGSITDASILRPNFFPECPCGKDPSRSSSDAAKSVSLPFVDGEDEREPFDPFDEVRLSGDEPSGVGEEDDADADGANGDEGELVSTGVEGVDVPDEVPNNCSNEYSIPFTLANSR